MTDTSLVYFTTSVTSLVNFISSVMSLVNFTTSVTSIVHFTTSSGPTGNVGFARLSLFTAYFVLSTVAVVAYSSFKVCRRRYGRSWRRCVAVPEHGTY